MKKDAMMHAIKARRGQGLDIHIILGGDDQKKSDEMAPDAPEVDEMKDPLDPQGMDHTQMPMEEPGQESMDKEMLDYHGGYEEMPDHKPRSLGERAKMAFMKRVGKK